MPQGKKIFASVTALIIAAALFPQVAGAWLVNQANVAIAHAAALPPDSSQRSISLNDAESDLTLAGFFSSGDRRLLAYTRLLLAQGNPTGAAQTFAQRSTRLQSDPIARLLWAEAASESNQAVIAIGHWRAAGAYVYYSQQMHRAMDSHAWQAAEEYARIAVAIEPNSSEAHLVLGDALSQREIDNPESLSELDLARDLTRNPELLSTILSRKGEVLVGQDKAQQAIDLFDEARTIAPLDARPRTDYALTLLKLQPDERDNAIAMLNQIVSDSPWYAAAYIALANISNTSGDAIGAETWLNRGLESNPDNPDLLFALGQFYVRQDRVEEARTILVRAMTIETHPDNLKLIVTALKGLARP